ncbi:uncharacterized protein LOC129594722 [Paramacrobiotus metropolitanus]|uniref:uncharacterized protein LOC129594722 n=1 Tax=Paramacrobiotus metropolitanus TaxID=2943436 RepID=UPI0024461449|nr:uncharacterized protein LOC129594722 [Paramacrobiotus metropolitanus]
MMLTYGIRTKSVFFMENLNVETGIEAVIILALQLVAMVFVAEKVQEIAPTISLSATMENTGSQGNLPYMSLQLLSNLNSSNAPGFSVAGICGINRAFLAAMIGLISTYVLLTWDKNEAVIHCVQQPEC